MPAAIQPALPVEVNEVDQEFSADGAGETGRVPAGVGARSAGEDADVARRQSFFALEIEEKYFCIIICGLSYCFYLKNGNRIFCSPRVLI